MRERFQRRLLQLALQEYEKFNQNRLVKNVDDSDFDKFIKKNRLK